MAYSITLSATGVTKIATANQGAGVGGWYLVFTANTNGQGTTWNGSAVLAQNRNAPGTVPTPPLTGQLTNVGYYNPSTGAAVAAGTAITATGNWQVDDVSYDLYIRHTLSTAGTTVTVTVIEGGQLIGEPVEGYLPADNPLFSGILSEIQAQTTPAAYTATTFAAFASAANGATLMGFGTTYDVALLQKSGAVALGVLTGTTSVSLIGNLTSAAGKIGLGTTPGTTGAINVDAVTAAYSTVAFRAINGAADFQVKVAAASHTDLINVGSVGSLILGANNERKIAIPPDAAGTARISFQQSIAAVVGGATSTTFYQSNGSTVAYQYLAAGAVGIGAAAGAATGLLVQNTATASGAAAHGQRNIVTMVAAANNDALFSFRVDPTVTPGAFTGLTTYGIAINAFSVAGYTSPGNPIGISVGVITGTGASVATALSLAPPTGATTNYLIAHTTAATFNVLSTGAITTAATIGIGAAADPSIGVYCTNDVLTTANQAGFYTDTVFTNAATSTGRGVYSGVTTAAAAFTLTARSQFYAANLAKGAGSTITNDFGIYVDGPTQGATLNVSAALHAAVAAPATAGAVAAGTPIRMYSGGVTIEVTSDAPTHTRPKGSICINTGGTTTATRIYINTDGAGTWTNLTAGA